MILRIIGYLSLYGTPTLQEIKETIVHHLGEEWRSVGDSLGMTSEVMKEIGSKFGSVPTHCSEAMFSKWLNHEEGTGHKERTWGTVLTALEDAGRGDLATAVLDELMVKHEGLCGGLSSLHRCSSSDMQCMELSPSEYACT